MIRRCFLLGLAVACFTGCPSLKGPGYLHPGTAAYQQREAERFDPFPEPDVGPDMAARPLAYMRPAPETERNQNAITFAERYGTAPPPGIYRPTRNGPPSATIPYVPPAPVQTAPLFVP
jgi:hypothetical protein